MFANAVGVWTESSVRKVFLYTVGLRSLREQPSLRFVMLVFPFL